MAVMSVTRHAETMCGVNFEMEALLLDKIGADTPDGIRWIQTVDTTDPMDGAPNPKVDNPTGSRDPFYWAGDMKKTKNFAEFEDDSKRTLPPAGKFIKWNATLTLCAVDLAKKYLVVHDIVTWGFTLQLMDGTRDVPDLVKLPLGKDWAAKDPHVAIVRKYFPDWQWSAIKYTPKP